MVASFLSHHALSPSDPGIFPAIVAIPCSEVIPVVGSPFLEKTPTVAAQSREEVPCEMGVPVVTPPAVAGPEQAADSRFSATAAANRI